LIDISNKVYPKIHLQSFIIRHEDEGLKKEVDVCLDRNL
jgi:hypothetical protein